MCKMRESANNILEEIILFVIQKLHKKIQRMISQQVHLAKYI